MFCHVNTQMVLLPYHFSLFDVFLLECRGHDNNLWIFSCAFAWCPVSAVARNFQPSLFSGQLERQPLVLVDQGWRSNKSCVRTSPKYQFDFHKRSTAQALLLAHAGPEVLPIPLYLMVSSVCLCLHEKKVALVALRVARLTLQTRKLWLVGVATDRNARDAGRSLLPSFSPKRTKNEKKRKQQKNKKNEKKRKKKTKLEKENEKKREQKYFFFQKNKQTKKQTKKKEKRGLK